MACCVSLSINEQLPSHANYFKESNYGSIRVTLYKLMTDYFSVPFSLGEGEPVWISVLICQSSGFYPG